MTYLAVYGALLFGGALTLGQTQLRRLVFAIAVCLLFVFVAFRFEVGCDWGGYEHHFEYTRFWDTAEALLRAEPAYWLLLVQLHSFAFEYPYINLLTAIPFFAGVLTLARRQPDPLAFLILAFPVLIINMPMSAIRQSAAIGFVCLAVVAFQDRKLIRYIILIAAGSLFHSSAIVFLALAPFVKFRLTRTTLALALLLVSPGMYFIAADAADFYADRYIDTGIDAAGGLYRGAMLAVVGAYFLLFLQRTNSERFPADHQMLVIGAWIMIGALVILPVSSVMSDRFGYYVTPIQLVIMARLPYLVRAREHVRLIALSPYLMLGLMLLVWTTNSYHFNHCYVPYQSWLSWRY